MNPYQKPTVADAPPSILHNDFLLFAGSNFDPVREGNKLTNFSFEAIFKFDLGKHVHMRVGGFSNRNFSVDSATALPKTRYINTKPGQPLQVGTSQIAIQTFSLDSRASTNSVGLYGDLLWSPVDNVDTRISFGGHVEYVRRTIVPSISIVGSVIGDTITYTQELANRNIVVGSQPTANDNIFTPNRHIDQYYMAVGIAIEKATKVFDLFIEPLFGLVVSNTSLSTRPTIYSQSYVNLGVKAQATIKLLGVTLAIDLKEINTSHPFTNVSIGIPISAKYLTDKIKNP